MEQTFFEWLQGTPIAVAVGESSFPGWNLAHGGLLLVLAPSSPWIRGLMDLASAPARHHLAERLLPRTWWVSPGPDHGPPDVQLRTPAYISNAFSSRWGCWWPRA